jgi:predicted pyridoxine 5'-phosphate oxidase superfamily flavin-nucleotide-binding protein
LHIAIERRLSMNEPVTTLDTRFSDPAAVATEWDQTRRVLETAELFWITTVRDDGRPHVTPLVAVWLDGAIHFSTGATEQKAVNLRGNPHVILTTGCNNRDRGLDVVVEGDAVQVATTRGSNASPKRGRQSGTGDGNTKRKAEASNTKAEARPSSSR